VFLQPSTLTLLPCGGERAGLRRRCHAVLPWAGQQSSCSHKLVPSVIQSNRSLKGHAAQEELFVDLIFIQYSKDACHGGQKQWLISVQDPHT